MCTLLTLSSFPRPGGGHTNVFVCTELLRSESELNVREDCDSCDSPSFPGSDVFHFICHGHDQGVFLHTSLGVQMMFQTPSYPEILYLTADIFSYSCPGFSGNTERNLPQRTVLAASSLAGLRCMMMSGFLSVLLCTDALVTPPL